MGMKTKTTEEILDKCLADIIAAGRRSKKPSVIVPTEEMFSKLSNNLKN